MCTKNQLYDITERIADLSKNTFGEKLDSVLLYGSYARGEETSESDIDIMVLADVNKEELFSYIIREDSHSRQEKTLVQVLEKLKNHNDLLIQILTDMGLEKSEYRKILDSKRDTLIYYAGRFKLVDIGYKLFRKVKDFRRSKQ